MIYVPKSARDLLANRQFKLMRAFCFYGVFLNSKGWYFKNSPVRWTGRILPHGLSHGRGSNLWGLT